MKASANIFPLVEFSEAAAPATPASGQVRIYAKADGLMYSKDDAGVESQLGGGAGTGDVVGPASSTDSHVALFDGITGKLLKDGGAMPAALTDGDKGDITVSASGATWTIDANAISTAKVADDAITYAKLQNVSATDMLLGRSTAGAGNAEEIPCTAFARSILDDVDAAAVRATIGVGTGTGDVVGPASAVDDRIATFDGTTGKLIQDGGKTIVELAIVGGNNIFDGTQNLNSAAAANRLLGFQTGGLQRWYFGKNNTAESGSDAGSNLILNRYDDAGSILATALTVTRATGAGAWSADWTAASINDAIGGVRLIPQNSKSAAYTLVLADSGQHIFHPSADTTPRIWTIPANASVAYPIGTALTFINQNGAGVITISITSDTMRLAGAGTTGSRTLAANGIATALKITSTEWIISGTGLT
jgi:hypothetical protein